MSISSQPQTSLDDFLKDITIDLSNTTTVVGAGSNPYIYDTATMSPITITTGGAGTYTIGNISSIDTMSIDSSSFTFNLPEEWVDAFPDWHRVEDMCKKYPGLEIAFRNFQTVYQLVKDDYDNPVPKK
jgi:hypothetical protein